MSYVLSCCSSADLPAQLLARRDIRYVPFHVFVDDVEYPDDLGCSLPYDAFYDAMARGCATRTAQINVDEYMRYFESLLLMDQDVLHVTLSSGLSGSYNSACIAAQELREKYPDRKLVILDSLSASVGQGMLMERLADMRDAGCSLEQLESWLVNNRLRLQTWFISTDLTWYIKGGRISKAAGWFGTMLNICPLLNVTREGKLAPRSKLRGKHAALKALAGKMIESVGSGYDGPCRIAHSACREDAEALLDLLDQGIPGIAKRAQISMVGTTIGAHTGPGTVGVFFWGEPREEE